MFGIIRNRQDETLDYTFHPGEEDQKTIVVIGHGVTGNKDRPFLVALAEALSLNGIPTLRMSFSGNGSSDGRFEDSTISKEAEDLRSVIDALAEWKVIYVGHSMGGAVGVLLASEDSRITGLVSLAGMVHTEAFAQREFNGVNPGEGFMWDEPTCPLSQAYIDDMAAITTVVTRAPSIQVPWLLVHGTVDDVVPLQDSFDIFERANEPKQLVQIDGADHVFSEHTPDMVKPVCEWIRKAIGRA
ncbi:MAG: alpha/beta fold hydrolase [Nitrospirales bacterium]|nr:alpha/beta fold hydrolase [Nitrospira sp.]MDR4502924.1 alpha/beta fold hydrolase [Nitrospirales bacterium]